MYVIVQSGARQYKATKGDLIDVDRLDKEIGKTVKLDKVLLSCSGKKVQIGEPFIKKASVTCEVVSHPRGPKTVFFMYKRRKSCKTKVGSRRDYTKLKVKDITIE